MALAVAADTTGIKVAIGEAICVRRMALGKNKILQRCTIGECKRGAISGMQHDKRCKFVGTVAKLDNSVSIHDIQHIADAFGIGDNAAEHNVECQYRFHFTDSS